MKGIRRLVSFVVFAIVCFNIAGCNNIQESTSPEINNTQDTNETIVSEEQLINPLYDDNLRLENEDIIFSFKTEKNNKILAICTSKEPDYIVYRFGTKDKVELEYPLDKTDSWNSFVYDYYLRGGGAANEGVDLNYLSFEKDNYIYRVYDEYNAVTDSNSVGINVIDKTTNKGINICGMSKDRVGTLVTLRESKVSHGSDSFTGF